MKNAHWQDRATLFSLFLLLMVLALTPRPVRAGVDLAVLPALKSVQPGEIFEVELTISATGSAFNGYDAVVGFDPAAVTFIQLSQVEQEGPLMTGACANNFHSFSIAPSADTLNITNILLCADTSVTGPGIVYRLRFQAGALETTTTINLLPGTAFYQGGFFVTPLQTSNAEIRVNAASPVPGSLLAKLPNLSAAPNPFNPTTTIRFEAAQATVARITVFSMRGALIADLHDGPVAAGLNAIVWNGRNTHGQFAGSGTYLVRLQIDGQSFAHRVTLLK